MLRLSQIFAVNGRITRRQFWFGHLIIFSSAIGAGIVGGIVLGVLSVLLASPALALWGPAALAALVTIGALAAEFCLTVRRMRDRDGSPWWIGVLAGLAVLADFLIGFNALASGESPVTPLTVALTVFALVLSGWIIVELGVLGSAAETDRFGALPRAMLRKLRDAFWPDFADAPAPARAARQAQPAVFGRRTALDKAR